jgi:hypothetical protein
MLPKIYADFHKLDDENRIVLTTVGTRNDLQRLGLQLVEGMPLTFYMDDADDQGNSDDIMVDGVARFSVADKCWVAEVKWDDVYHASDEATRNASNGASPKRPAQKA